VVSTKPQIEIAFPRSLSSLIPFMQPKISSTHPHIPFKSIQWPYSLNFNNSFFNTTTTPLNSGSVLVIWSLHKVVDKETKAFNPTLLFPSKMSWDFSKKNKCDDILNVWKMTFQASDLKGKLFLDLLDDNNNIIKPSYTKGGSWLKVFRHSNSLCVHALRAITNHAPIGKYRLKFFPREEFKCSCSSYPIESRRHILHECDRFNGYWNPRRDSSAHFIMFLVANLSAFAFTDNIPLSVMTRSCN